MMEAGQKEAGKSWRKEREERRKSSGLANIKAGTSKEECKDPEDSFHVSVNEDKKQDMNDSMKLERNDELDYSVGQEEESLRKEEEERIFLLNYIQDAEERLSRKMESRAVNLAAARDRHELDTARLDSSLKKNTAFIKRLKNLTESQYDQLDKELKGLNLSKYMSEVAQAIVEAKLKMADIPTAVHLCSMLHQRYHDFAPILLDNWQKILSNKKDEKISNLSKLRVDLRFYAELISDGIFAPKEGLPLLGNLLTTLVNCDKEEHQNISILLTFCRYCGEDYMGLIPMRIRELSEKHQLSVPKSDFLPTERQRNVCQLLKEYYASLTRHLINDHKELQNVEHQNWRILNTKGELSQERKELAESLSNSLSRLLSNAQQMAELLDEPLPALPENKISREEEGGMDVGVIEGNVAEASNLTLWEDEDTKAFYENLPDLKALIPSILYCDSEKATAPGIKEDILDEVDETIEVEGDEEIEVDTEDSSNVIANPEGEDDILPPDMYPEDDPDESLISGGSNTSQSNKILLEAFLNNLPNSISRDLIDSAAMEFCLKMNTKHNRKKLVRTIFLVPRTRLDLLPFYSRLVATLQPLMPDMATELVNMLKQDFKYQVKKKDQINIESKIKVVRFIGELVKFGVYPKSEALLCLRMLLQDFNHHHIEMACNLLETCGRFLYRKAESHHRTKIYLEQMLRKKAVKAFDPRHNTMIENAYFYVNPPESSADSSVKELPPMHEYIRKLLYSDLSKNNTEKILRQMRKLHWEDPEIAEYAVKCLNAVWNAKYYNIRCIANLVAGLISHYDWVGPAIVDAVVEDIRLGLEINHMKFNQRRIACVKYLGELYNYRIIESSLIFKILYSFITFGVSFDPNVASFMDPPDHLFRIRLICTLLETCGQFFSSGSSKRKLDCFITYFQHYYLFKHTCWPEEEEFPWQIDHLYKDTLLTVRPKLKLTTSLMEAENSLFEIHKQMLSKAVEQNPSLKQYAYPFIDEEDTQSPTLSIIPENESEIDDADDESIFPDDEFDDEANAELSEAHSLTLSQHSQTREFCKDEQEKDDEEMVEDLEKEINEPELDLLLKPVHCQEDDDFMAAFDRMRSDNFLERNKDQQRPQGQISVPVHIRSSVKKTYDQIVSEDILSDSMRPTINFVLLTKSGNKQQFSTVEMPVDSELVAKLRTSEEAERAEREKVKRMTLEINERQEEEEAQEIIQQAQRPPTVNFNRERRPKYQHPKGAPDADLIFGSRKAR